MNATTLPITIPEYLEQLRAALRGADTREAANDRRMKAL